MRRWILLSKKHLIVMGTLLGSAVVGAGATAAVLAAIPDADGTIHGCYRNATNLIDPKGGLRIIDAASESCASGETALNWSAPIRGGFVDSLAGADFSNASLQYRDFKNQNMSDSYLNNANLTGSDLRGATLNGVNMYYTVLSRANLQDVDLSHLASGTSIEISTFDNAVVSGASFSGDTIHATSFQNATASNANFTSTHFDGVNLTGTDLSTATITGATWNDTICPDASYSGANSDTCVGHLTP